MTSHALATCTMRTGCSLTLGPTTSVPGLKAVHAGTHTWQWEQIDYSQIDIQGGSKSVETVGGILPGKLNGKANGEFPSSKRRAEQS